MYECTLHTICKRNGFTDFQRYFVLVLEQTWYSHVNVHTGLKRNLTETSITSKELSVKRQIILSSLNNHKHMYMYLYDSSLIN